MACPVWLPLLTEVAAEKLAVLPNLTSPNFRGTYSTYQTENPRGFSIVGENKQLLIALVVMRYSFSFKNFTALS